MFKGQVDFPGYTLKRLKLLPKNISLLEIALTFVGAELTDEIIGKVLLDEQRKSKSGKRKACFLRNHV